MIKMLPQSMLDNPKRSIVLLLHVLLLAWQLIVSAVSLSMSPMRAVFVASVMYTALSAWMVWSWIFSGERLLSPYLLFLLSAMAFNGGQVWLYALGAIPVLLNGVARPETLLRSIAMVTASLMFLHLGALSASTIQLSPRRDGKRFSSGATRLVGWVLLAVSSVPATIMLRRAVEAVRSSGYFVGLYQSDKPVGFDATPALVGQFLIPSAFLLLASYREREWVRALSLVLTAIYVGTYFFLGSRGPAVMALVGYVWLWNSAVRKIRLVTLAVWVCSLLLLLPTLALIRDVPSADRAALAIAAQAIQKVGNPLVALIKETGGTLMTVALTIDLVPSSRPFDYGASYAYALLSIVPNVFGGNLHPSLVHGSLADWLVQTVDPTFATLGGGYGYSFIAEGYANYGWFGLPFLMTTLGAVIQLMSTWATRTASPQRLAVVAIGLGPLMLFARSETISLMRTLAWCCVGPYALAATLEKVTRAVAPTSSWCACECSSSGSRTLKVFK